MFEFLLALSAFFFGIAAGQVMLVFQAHREQGYKANNGKRYRLVEANSPADRKGE